MAMPSTISNDAPGGARPAPHKLAGFADSHMQAALNSYDAAALDRLTFGLIRLDASSVVTFYNVFESRVSGITSSQVLGRDFFECVAPCMNNFMVSLRFQSEPELDAIIDYVLSLRMRPTPVRLRLLASATSVHRYLLVERA